MSPSSVPRPTRGAAEPPGAVAGRSARLDGDPGLDGLLTSTCLHRAQMVVAHDLMRRRVRGRADEDLSGPGDRLQPVRGVHHITHRGVVATGAQRTDEHLAGVDPDAHLDAVRNACGVLCDRLLHAERGAHGPLRIVFVREGRTEQSEDRVTDDLVDLPTERSDICHEALEAVVHQVLQLLGVHRLGKTGEADQVSEQHRHDAPLVRARHEVVPARGAEPCPGRRDGAA